MTTDVNSEQTNNDQMIEALIGNDTVKVWVPIMATNLYMVDTFGDIQKVQALQIRDLKKEKDNE